jgi:hypothetical protein
MQRRYIGNSGLKGQLEKVKWMRLCLPEGFVIGKRKHVQYDLMLVIPASLVKPFITRFNQRGENVFFAGLPLAPRPSWQAARSQPSHTPTAARLQTGGSAERAFPIFFDIEHR